MVPVFQHGAACLTKFGPESGETANEIIFRKDLERRSGTAANMNEFWWGIGEKGTAQSINLLVAQYGANVALFCAIKKQDPPKKHATSDVLVWRKYRALGSTLLHDVPPHVLISSAAMTKGGDSRTIHFALVCKSPNQLKIGGNICRLANHHYKNLSKGGSLGRASRGQRTTTALVKWTSGAISEAECDCLVDFSAQLCAPHCVELHNPKKVPIFWIVNLNQQIAQGLLPSQWVPAVGTIRR